MQASELPAAAGSTAEYFAPETGCTVRGAFFEFFQRFGLEICGLPLTNAIVENGITTQYFQRVALEASPQGVRLRPLGSEVLALREVLRRQRTEPVQVSPPEEPLLGPPPFPLTNLVGQLAVHPTERYSVRAVSQIRTLVIHHTGAAPDVPPAAIAEYHVSRLGWPGIGYHFLVGADGQVFQTNALVTESFHARQSNATSVGIALAGNFTDITPPEAQMDALAALCAWLSGGLRLGIDAIVGHRELVDTPCPGQQWTGGDAWKNLLQARVDAILHPVPGWELSISPQPSAISQDAEADR